MKDLDSMLIQVDSMEKEIISLAKSLIQIPSVNTGSMPTGNETAVCKLVSDWLSIDSINCEILEATPGRGNLIANLPGISGKAGLMFMSHTDVVPIEDDAKWTYPPFSATVSNGRIYGRGAADCKGLLASQMMAMRILKRNGVTLNDGLILASGADEEHGGRYGFEWLANKYPEKISAPYAVNEGGGTPIKSSKASAYQLTVGEKGRLQIEIEVKGSSAHASIPWQGSNALYGAAKVVERIKHYEPLRDTSSDLFNYLSVLAIEDIPSPENIETIISDMEKESPNLASTLRALSRMTVTPTMVQGGIKSNSVPDSIIITCDVRTLPHQNEDYVNKELSMLFRDIPNVDFSIDYMAVPNSSPFDTDFVKNIETATSRALGLGNIQWIPSLSTGFTDSRFTRLLGTETYGLIGSHPDDDPLDTKIHGVNESESVRSLVTGTKVMLALAYEVLVK